MSVIAKAFGMVSLQLGGLRGLELPLPQCEQLVDSQQGVSAIGQACCAASLWLGGLQALALGASSLPTRSSG